MSNITGALVPARNIFRINDIDLVIPPTQISVRKEDLAWSWKTLRTKSSTKIPSGHGMIQASITIYFTPDLLLDLHRLVVEFRQSPFCWVSNDFLRQTIVPHWDLWQALAFTMTSISVSPMRGHPGTFVCELDLRWFNYAPYMFNYLFRREWLTEPVKSASGNVRLSIPVYGAHSGTELSIEQSIFVSPQDVSALEQYEILSQKRADVVAGSTIQDMEARHGGIVFDNFPLPNRMEKSQIVSDPAMSNIYVRYINSLQQKALWKGFGIDACADILAVSDRETWERFTIGEAQPSGQFTKVRRLNDFSYLPQGVGEQWIRKMLETSKFLTFTYHQYLSVKLPPDVQMSMKALYEQIISDQTRYFDAIAAETARRLENWSERKYGTYSYKGATIPGANPDNPDALSKMPWYPPCKAAVITSPFGTRQAPVPGASTDHQAIDLALEVGSELYATNDGVASIVTDHDGGGGLSIVIMHKQLGYKSTYCHLSKVVIENAQTVKRGELIGYSGGAETDPNAGRSSGPHLHFALYNLSLSKAVDPYPLLNQKAGEGEVDPVSYEEPPVEEVPTQSVEPDKDSFDLNNINGENGTVLGLTPEQQSEIARQYVDLAAQGWTFYEEDQSVLNVWHRIFSVSVASQSTDSYTDPETYELLSKEGAVITSMTGGLQHIVASIPIIGHEFPTHQHLGSIEPNYLIELAILDDSYTLTGVSTVAQMLESMRASLQESARTFRIVPDCWTVCTDHFITRLFGTYTEDDILNSEEEEYTKLRKRSMITAAQTETKEGNPGLSSMLFEIAETNPYETETIHATKELVSDIEERRALTLKALYEMKLEGPARAAATLALGETLGIDQMDSFRANDAWKAAIGGVSGKEQRVISFEHLSGEVNDATTAGAVGIPGTAETLPSRYEELALLLGYGSGLNFLEIDHVLRSEPLLDPLYIEGTASQEGMSVWEKGWGSDINATSLEGDSSVDQPLKDRLLTTGDLRTIVYDATEFYRLYPEFDKTSIDDLIGFYNLLKSLLKTTRRMMCETAVTDAFGLDEIKDKLYWKWAEGKAEKEVWPQMYSQFAYYLTGVLGGTAGNDAGIQKLNLSGIDGRVINFDQIPESDKVQLTEREWLRSIKSTVLRIIWDTPFEVLKHAGAAWAAINYTTLNILMADDSLTELGKHNTLSSWFKLNSDVKASYKGEKAQEAVDSYVGILPLWANVPDRIANSFPLLGDIVSRGGQLDESFGMYASFDTFVLSSWLIHGNTSWLPIAISKGNPELQAYNALSEAALRAFPNDPKIAAALKSGEKEVEQESFSEGFKRGARSTAPGKVYKPAVEVTSEDYHQAIQAILAALPKSHIRYPCSSSIEANKLSWLRSLFAQLANMIMEDARMMALLGLEDLIDFNTVNTYRGSECYPDLELPAHPYYPKEQFATTPDFYMWNLYEDGPGALNQEVLDLVTEQASYAIQGPYDHLKAMMGKGIKPFEDRDKRLQVTGTLGDFTPNILNALKASWEGCDQTEIKINGEYVNLGEMLTAFPNKDDIDTWRAKGDAGLQELEKLVQEVGEKAPSQQMPMEEWRAQYGDRTKNPDEIKYQELKDLFSTVRDLQSTSLKPIMPLLSMFDGNPQYTQIPRADLETYKQLQDKIAQTELFFGSRAGYLGQYLTKETAALITQSTTDTRVAALDSYTHAFDPASLLSLAQSSAADILSEKLTMRRAFPTFKLMFVEEDEFEGRWLNFDDFHSYNAVKEFVFVDSRDMAASTCSITLQNVSGTLDGTKRNVVTDLDYFKNAELEKIEADSKYTMMDSRRESAPRIDSSQDQPFGAVVLRPGLNVQLRCGFSNDPGLLEVLISGRVVDVTWNSSGDMCEIMVQSFGTEMVQILKGVHDFYEGGEQAGDKEIYRTTHQLLGSMMLSPELKHFGRWEFGQYYQYGESQDSRLDFFDYAQKSFLSRFKVLTGVSRWIATHPGWTVVAAIGLAALATFTPAGRGGGALMRSLSRFGRFGRWIGLGGEAAAIGERAALQRATRAAVVGLNPNRSLIMSRVPGLFTSGATQVERDIARAMAAIDPAKSQLMETVGLAEIKAIQAATHVSERSLYASSLLGFPGGFSTIKSGIWVGGFKPTVYNIGRWGAGRFWSLGVAAPFRLTTVALVGAAGADLSRYLLFTPLYNLTIGNLKKFYARNQVTLMLSPQDDNLYPPSPKDYMRLKSPSLAETIGRASWSSGNALFAVFTGMNNDHDNLENWWNAWHHPDWILDKRVEPQQCIYRPQQATIWDIFHEMSLRHPGWVYGSRPYGNKFQYTMFFGVPSQRYWSKPAGNDFVFRMNMLRDMLDRGEITKDQYIRLYGKSAYSSLEMSTRISSHIAAQQQSPANFLGEDYPGVEEWESEASEHGAALTIKMTNQAMDEYLRGLEARFVPFRRYHMITSEQDIVANNIMSSEHNVANAVNVIYRSVDEKQSDVPTASVTLRANSMIPEDQIVCEPVEFPNCKGYTMALRYGMGQLIYNLKQMYRGEVLVLGNPRIRPWDICILMDRQNDIFGPVEVEQVVHTFSHETGFVTEIKPNALVFANEVSTWPIIEALKVWIMAKKDFENGKQGLTVDETDKMIDESWDEMVSDEMRADIHQRLAAVSEGRALEDLLPSEDENDLSIRDGTGGLSATAGVVGMAATTIASGLAAGTVGSLAGGLVGIKTGNAAAAGVGVALGAGAGLATALGGAAFTNFVVGKIADPLGFSWLIAGPILFNKCLQDDVVAVVPLLKNGQPIVSGLTYRDPLGFWNSFRGKVSNIIDDTYAGTRDQIIDWNTYGFEWWRRFKDPNKPAMIGY